jgi:hypothetical protein
MYFVKAVVAGGLTSFAMTIIYAVVAMRKAAAAARAAGVRGEIGFDLSFFLRDPTYLFLAVISFAFGFLLVLRLHWRK